MTLDPMGALLGLLTSVAVVAALAWRGARRPLRMVDRIAPFVGSAAVVAPRGAADRTIALPGLRRTGSLPSFDAVRVPGAVRVPDAVRVSGGARLLWSVVGGVIGLALAALLTADQPRPAAWAALTVTGAVTGRWLQRARQRARVARERREIDQQVPVLADLLALAVSAGATPMAALARSAAVLQGALGSRLDTCLARLRTGTPLVDALDALAHEAQVPSLTRLTEAIAQAHARGTPLTDVVRAQAADARADERRRLLESGGRKDVAMLVPIVFLVLPTVILIAVFPGLRALEVVVP